MTCVAYLLHNCIMKVRSHFDGVDQPIAKGKLVTVKNKTTQTRFATIGHPLLEKVQRNKAVPKCAI